MSAAARVKILIAFMCVAMVVYFLILGKMGIALVQTGKAAAIGMGVGVLILPFIGLWAMIATLRAGFAHQRLAALAAQQGRELDVSALRTTPSGRVNREDADALFATVKAEVEAEPGDWVGWYRLARAYDYAGDRRRARKPCAPRYRCSRTPRDESSAGGASHPVAGHPRTIGSRTGGCQRPGDFRCRGGDPACSRRDDPGHAGCRRLSFRHHRQFWLHVRRPQALLRHRLLPEPRSCGRAAYGVWVHGNNDTVGAAAAVDKIVTGLALEKAADVLEVVGPIDASTREQAYNLGGTLAAILMR